MVHKDAKIGKSVIWHEYLSNIGNCVIGNDCTIHSHVWIGDGVVLGDGVKVQAFSFIPPGVTIGNHVFIGPRVTFTNDKHPPSDRGSWQETVVEDHVSIGAGAVILPGVLLEEGCVVGAGAIVTKKVLKGQVVVGNPARVIHTK